MESMSSWSPNKFALSGLSGSSVLLFASPIMAQTTPVDELELEVAKVNDVYDAVVPVAVGAAVFAIGMILIKRIAFS